MIKIHTLIFSPFEVNTYILTDETGECVIIDPACYTEQEKKELVDFITGNELKPVRMLNTHCHLDHVFGNKFVGDTYHLGSESHSADEIILSNAYKSAQMYELSMDTPNSPVNYLNEGDIVKFGNSQIEILHIPGHTPGHLVFYNTYNKFAIAGDVIFAGSIGRTDFPGGDYDTLISGIKTKLYTLPDDTVIYCGHGPETTVGKERETNPFVRG